MPIDRLPNLPSGADVFLDANIFIYAFSTQSQQCLIVTAEAQRTQRGVIRVLCVSVVKRD